jgi:hypothetical protein
VLINHYFCCLTCSIVLLPIQQIFKNLDFNAFASGTGGKGVDGRSEIYKTDTLLIPHLDDDHVTDCQQPKSSVDHPKDESGGTDRELETSGAGATNDVNMAQLPATRISL